MDIRKYRVGIEGYWITTRDTSGYLEVLGGTGKILSTRGTGWKLGNGGIEPTVRSTEWVCRNGMKESKEAL